MRKANIQKEKKIIPKSSNMNISYQFFNYKIVFVNSLHENTNSKGDFVLRFGMLHSNNKHLRFKIPSPLNTIFNLRKSSIVFANLNLSQKYLIVLNSISKNSQKTHQKS